MAGMERLIKYYESDAESCSQILTDKQYYVGLLEQKCLLILLRYIENIIHLETTLQIKTLLLAVRLIKADPIKMKNTLFNLQIRINKNGVIQSSKGMDLIRCLIYKLGAYFNYLIQNEISSLFPGRKQLDILTANLLKLSQSSFSKDKELAKYCDFAYWMAEDQLFQLWNKINSETLTFQNYDSKQFHQFYKKYTNFCTFRRKIPKLKHKKLKDLIIKSDLNSKIQLKYKEIAKKMQLEAQMTNKIPESLIKGVNFQKLSIPDDFQ